MCVCAEKHQSWSVSDDPHRQSCCSASLQTEQLLSNQCRWVHGKQLRDQTSRLWTCTLDLTEPDNDNVCLWLFQQPCFICGGLDQLQSLPSNKLITVSVFYSWRQLGNKLQVFFFFFLWRRTLCFKVFEVNADIINENKGTHSVIKQPQPKKET